MADGMGQKTTGCYMSGDDRGVLRTKLRATNAHQVPRDRLENLRTNVISCRLRNSASLSTRNYVTLKRARYAYEALIGSPLPQPQS